MLYPIRDMKKLYVSPVVSFEMMEDDERMLMVSGTAGDNDGSNGEIGGLDAKQSDFIFDDGIDEGFEYQLEGLD